MVAQTYNPSIQAVEEDWHKFEARWATQCIPGKLDPRVTPFLRKPKRKNYASRFIDDTGNMTYR